jgi:DNA-binding MarR family transcriptional regulator
MKQEFIKFLDTLMEACPEIVNNMMTADIQAYINTIKNNTTEKPEITDNGKVILDFLQKSDTTILKARDIAEGLFISSRAVSGTLRKLVSDGFVEKIGSDPAVYTITEKGKNYKID